VFIVIGSLAGAAVVAIFAVRVGYPAVRYLADSRGSFYFGMRRFSRRLERKGIPSPTRTGWLAWAENIKKRISAAAQVDGMIQTVLKLTYGGEKWQPEAASRFTSFRRYVLKQIRRRSKRRDR